MKVEMMSVERLIPYARNPRTNDNAVDAVAASIREFGWRQPIVVDGEMVVLVGHTRLKAAHKLGLKEVPVHVAENLTESQKKAYRIADNRTGEYSEWDNDLLALEVEDLRLDGFDLDTLAFEDGEIDELLATLDATPEGNTDADDVPAVQAEVVTKPGDVWVLGRHRVMCGDSTDAGSVALLMNGERAELIYTDPPYGISIVGKSGTVGGGGLAKAGIYAPIAGDESIDVAIDAIRVIRSLEPKVQIIWGGNYYASHLPNISSWIIWDKRGEMNSNNFADCELAWCSAGSPARIYRQVWSGMIKEGESGSRVHPTQKPVKLAEWCINQYGTDCQVVVDLFNGSGSTLIAAEQTGRRCYAMELSPQYVDVAVRRWQQFTGKVATLEATGEPFPE